MFKMFKDAAIFTLCLQESSVDDLGKQFGPTSSSGLIRVQTV